MLTEIVQSIQICVEMFLIVNCSIPKTVETETQHNPNAGKKKEREK